MPSFYYMKGIHLAVLDTSAVEVGYYINRLMVPEPIRSQAIGTNLMNQVCAWADECQHILWIDPVDYYGSDSTRLEDFYRRFGFKHFRRGTTMVRKPRRTP
jgi:GNAT superfamily N-acetyltransferase